MWIFITLRIVKVVAEHIVIPIMRERVPKDEVVLVALTRGEQATLRSRNRSTMDAAATRYGDLHARGLICAQEIPG